MDPLASVDRTFLSAAEAGVRSRALRGRCRRSLMRDLALFRFALLLGLVGLMAEQALTMKLFLTFLLVITVGELVRDFRLAGRAGTSTLREEIDVAERFREGSGLLRKSMFAATAIFASCSTVFLVLTALVPEIWPSSVQMVLETGVFALFLAYWYVACSAPVPVRAEATSSNR